MVWLNHRWSQVRDRFLHTTWKHWFNYMSMPKYWFISVSNEGPRSGACLEIAWPLKFKCIVKDSIHYCIGIRTSMNSLWQLIWLRLHTSMVLGYMTQIFVIGLVRIVRVRRLKTKGTMIFLLVLYRISCMVTSWASYIVSLVSPRGKWASSMRDKSAP